MIVFFARYLVLRGKRVLLSDESEGTEILSRLSLPKELPDCLFYQGVNYRIRKTEKEPESDILLRFVAAGERVRPDVVWTDWDPLRLDRAAGLALAKDALLVVSGVPERGIAVELLRQMESSFPKAQLLELPLKTRDLRAEIALGYGKKISVRRLSGECLHLFRYLSDRFAEEVEADDRCLLE